jgi:hypothetical protein
MKRNEEKPAAVRASLSAVTGVTNVANNVLTGSITVHYDWRKTRTPVLLDVLKNHGWLEPTVAIHVSSGDARVTRRATRARGTSGRNPPLRQSLAKAVAGFLVEKAIERSLIALVAAVL